MQASAPLVSRKDAPRRDTTSRKILEEETDVGSGHRINE